MGLRLLENSLRLPKDDFFEGLNGLALTYDDVVLSTNYSEMLPRDVDITSKFSRRILLKTPIVSAAMDTVTESDMAIAMAMMGGIGVLHKNNTPERQAKEATRVKLHMNICIDKPITAYEDQRLGEILDVLVEKRYKFRTIPVTKRDGSLTGILTGKDFEPFGNSSQYAKDVMTKNVTTGKQNMSLDDAFELMKKEKITVLPLVDEVKHLTGLYVFSDLKRLKDTQHGYNLDEKGRLLVGAAVGVYDSAYARLELLAKKGVDVVVIDTAHADSKSVFETLKEIKKNYPNIDVVAGNISEGHSAKRLLDLGADGIKVGQGPGAICTTRIVTGTGKPQLSAVYDCERAIRGENAVPICADGGLKYSGDITKAIAVGAHSVMMGGMLAGTEETPGEIIVINGVKWKEYRGMGSLEAMAENPESRGRYLQDNVDGKDKNKLIPEGIVGRVLYKGPVSKVLFQCIGGLRSGMGYQGMKNIEELRKNALLFRFTTAGKTESHPHDITITKDAPNYKPE